MTKKQLHDMLLGTMDLVPQTYGEAIVAWSEAIVDCEPHEWDNRTTTENTDWLLRKLYTHVFRHVMNEEKIQPTESQAFKHLIVHCMTCKRRNTPEWMAKFAERINVAIAAIGCKDRVRWPGSWSNEFHFESGGDSDD